MYKRVFSLGIILLSIFIIPSVAFADAASSLKLISNPHRFSDVTRNDIEALYLIEKNIIRGNPDGTLGLSRPLNRAEAMVIFTRFFELTPKYDPACSFPDVPKEAWYAPYVSAMCSAKLVKGYSGGSFGPGNQLTRAEAFQILVRGFQEVGKHEIEKYVKRGKLPTDVKVGIWYEAAARYAKARNLDNFTNNRFAGSKFYSRRDLFVNLYRLMRTEELEKDRYYARFDPVVINEDKLVVFSKTSDFDSYAKKLKARLTIDYELSMAGGAEEGGFVEESVAASTAETGADDLEKESITNVQEKGVDEGGIVKAYGDYLVTLRRGKLFTIRLDNPLVKISELAAYPDGLDSNGWYDEMLVLGDTIIVVGYSYERRATEIELFTIDGSGNLTYNSTYFLDSNDYYSSRNYTSRLVGDELIFYVPANLFSADYSEIVLPTLKELAGEETKNIEILKKTDIFKPIESSTPEVLHTVVRCKVGDSKLNCSAKAILGSYSRTFYIAPSAVYVWVSDTLLFYDYNEELSEDQASGSYDRAVVYRMDLTGDNVAAARAFGQPIDQFSFKDDGTHLNVLVSDHSWGDGMWSPEFTDGDIHLMRIKLDMFNEDAPPISRESVSKLPKLEYYNIQNRFVGDYIVYGESNRWRLDTSGNYSLYVKAYKEDSPAQTISLTHSADRIDILGDTTAVVIGEDGGNLKFSSVLLPGTPAVHDTYTIEQASEGELRSHGFFFKPSKDGAGMLGLPIRRQGEVYESYLDESSEVLYLAVSSEKKFSLLGSLAASGNQPDDNCEVSCIDWYGNSRPIFYRGRVFALLGYELVEGKIADGSLSEVQRINFN